MLSTLSTVTPSQPSGLLAARVEGKDQPGLRLLDITVRRNAYGRQLDSFREPLRWLSQGSVSDAFEGVFIRAPKIHGLGENVKPLGFHGEEVVLARNNRVLAATFHPELTRDARVHRYFMGMVEEAKGA